MNIWCTCICIMHTYFLNISLSLKSTWCLYYCKAVNIIMTNVLLHWCIWKKIYSSFDWIYSMQNLKHPLNSIFDSKNQINFCKFYCKCEKQFLIEHNRKLKKKKLKEMIHNSYYTTSHMPNLLESNKQETIHSFACFLLIMSHTKYSNI